ncbi:hypothetical protein NDU88_000198 [Pleurodeles waltl]|uniref:Uncharacterized protein n=1 Tax=Pleurodeles waltl TaxID=8319 RepID=A0AAV7LXH9_PLEWA|nr:hypothetical protein NDU88_000198 [Pleurodeles waltl]
MQGTVVRAMLAEWSWRVRLRKLSRSLSWRWREVWCVGCSWWLRLPCEGEDELSVVSVGNDVEAVGSNDVGEWSHVDIEGVGLSEDPWGTLQMVLVAFDQNGGRQILCVLSERKEVIQSRALWQIPVSKRHVEEDEGNGFTCVEPGPDVVGAGDEGGRGAVVFAESRLGDVK